MAEKNAAIGFAILSHNDPDQLARLVATLDATYDRPPIAIHHNFSFSSVDRDRFGDNARFVEPNLPTEWGSIKLVYALLSALRLLYRDASPDWFTMLTAGDYPVRPGGDVVAELTAGAFDLYMDWRLAERNPAPLANAFPSRMGTHLPDWRRIAYERYVAKTIWYPSLTKRLRRTKRNIVVGNEWLLAPFVPFTKDWKCYAGETFFTGNGRVADILLSAERDHPETFRHYGKCFAPDESIFHTLLCNHADLRICSDNKRYSNWIGQNANPRWIEFEDIAAISEFGCHYARKFASDRSARILAEIDRNLLGLGRSL